MTEQTFYNLLPLRGRKIVFWALAGLYLIYLGVEKWADGAHLVLPTWWGGVTELVIFFAVPGFLLAIANARDGVVAATSATSATATAAMPAEPVTSSDPGPIDPVTGAPITVTDL